MQINNFLFIGIVVCAVILGIIVGERSTKDYKKALEKEYEQKHQEIYNRIRKETRGEWSCGWDAAYKSLCKSQKAYYLWFREHGYSTEEINDWFERYMNGRTTIKQEQEKAEEA